MHEKTCILVPTWAPYLSTARLTLQLIDQYWHDHPTAWLCGVASSARNVLPLMADPSNWMAVVRGAVIELRARGFVSAYLILDDQGPIDLCHAQHLNETVPRWMTELDAIYISIRGWDHRRNSSGRSLGRHYLSLQRQRADYPWRYALHPALWRLDVLETMLGQLLTEGSGHQHSPWDFEIRAGQTNTWIDPSWNSRTYRVCGRAMMAVPMPDFERLARHLVDGIVRKIDRTLDAPLFHRQSWPPRLTNIVMNILQTVEVYYEGPYPMHFCGFLVNGQLNQPLARFLRRRKQHELLRKIEEAAP